jgi:hypothetical protein
MPQPRDVPIDPDQPLGRLKLAADIRARAPGGEFTHFHSPSHIHSPSHSMFFYGATTMPLLDTTLEHFEKK